MTRLCAVQGDITVLPFDAIVNAANSGLAGGGGVDGAIHRAGGPSILTECQAWVSEHGHLPTGEAMLTTAGDLPTGHVIHTVGPIWGEHGERESRRLLARCYYNSLELAAGARCRNVAFPCISTGVYGYPKEKAAETAVEAVTNWTNDRPVLDEVTFVCFSADNLVIYEGLLGSDGSRLR
jgi:O-acetyl-ADP-ribose deacetylase (regulator of RNase III)